MENKNAPTILAFFFSLLVFLLSAISYEYYVLYEYWKSKDTGALIRVDIFMIYPIFLIIALVVFFILKKYLKKIII